MPFYVSFPIKPLGKKCRLLPSSIKRHGIISLLQAFAAIFHVVAEFIIEASKAQL